MRGATTAIFRDTCCFSVFFGLANTIKSAIHNTTQADKHTLMHASGTVIGGGIGAVGAEFVQLNINLLREESFKNNKSFISSCNIANIRQLTREFRAQPYLSGVFAWCFGVSCFSKCHETTWKTESLGTLNQTILVNR
eukprot:UN07744